jgi:hypothetical protein
MLASPVICQITDSDGTLYCTRYVNAVHPDFTGPEQPGSDVSPREQMLGNSLA